MPIGKGSAIFLRDTYLREQVPEHLYFVISDADMDGKVLLVNLTTDNGHPDRSCVIKLGQHPFVKHQSVINYRDAREANLTAIEEAVQRGAVTTHISATDDLLAQIQTGARNSMHLKGKFKRFYNFF